MADLLTGTGSTALAQQANLTRDFEEVVLTGDDLPAFQNQPADRIHLYRYDATAGSFQPIPFQIDARCTAYWAVVKALDWGGNESAASAEVSGTPGP